MKGLTPSQNKIDVDTTTSRRGGLAGLVEAALRRFRTPMHVAMVMPLYGLASVVIGIAVFPGAYLWQEAFDRTVNWPIEVRTLALSMAGAAAYFTYAFSMIIVVPAVNFGLRTKLKAWRGPYYSLPSIPWYIHNGSTYLVRYTVLEFITPTPFNILFFKLMGMKIGRGTVINSSNISDPSLITMGEKVTVGGSVTIVGHYGQAGYLVLAPVKIGNRVTIGLKASIMGGAEIGDEAKILPHSVVMPKTVIPAGETWGGVPAVKLTDAKPSLKKAS